MAKMFYTLDEAAQKLGKSPEEVQALAESGQLQEFRDRDNLVFKVDQVDLLAGGDDDSEIQLAESGDLEPISLSSSGSGSAFGLDSSGEASGVSIFDPDGDDEMSDPSAETLVTNSPSSFDAGPGASGSGLAQLSLEPDDTSLGGNLLDDVFGGEGGGSVAGESAMGDVPVAAAEGGALFESTGEADPLGGAPSPMMAPMVEAYDGPWSGIAGGLALGMTLVTALALAVLILGVTGAGSGPLLDPVAGSMGYIIMGGAAGVLVVFSLIGFALLRKS